jgi:hypothetical protein
MIRNNTTRKSLTNWASNYPYVKKLGLVVSLRKWASYREEDGPRNRFPPALSLFVSM